MKKGVLIILIALTAMVTSCGKIDETIINEEEKTDIEEIAEELSNDEDYIETIEDFQNQFMEYGALCMEYEGRYGVGGFDEQTKVEMIAFSEGLYRAKDSEGPCYDYYQPYIKPERVSELAKYFFGEKLDYDELEKGDKDDIELFFDSSDHRAYVDEDGGIIACIGDWGLMGPKSKKVRVEIEDEFIYVSNKLIMYDYEENEEAYELGKYTLVLEYDPEDPDEFWIVDFYFERSENAGLVNITNDTNNTDNANIDSPEYISLKLAEYYNETYKPEGNYVVFDNETIITDEYYIFTVRYQMSDREQEERMADGQMPLANVYVDSVTVDRTTFVCTNEYGETFTY